MRITRNTITSKAIKVLVATILITFGFFTELSGTLFIQYLMVHFLTHFDELSGKVWWIFQIYKLSVFIATFHMNDTDYEAADRSGLKSRVLR